MTALVPDRPLTEDGRRPRDDTVRLLRAGPEILRGAGLSVLAETAVPAQQFGVRVFDRA